MDLKGAAEPAGVAEPAGACDLTETSEQRDLRDAVRRLLTAAQRNPDAAPAEGPGPADRPGPAERPGPDRSLWRRLCGEIGVAGLAVPERFGGAGAGPAETHVVMEELGRTLAPVPMLGSAVLAAQALLAAGDEAACRRLLPPIADGTAIATLAWAPEAGGWNPAGPAFAAVPPEGAPPDSVPPGTPAPGSLSPGRAGGGSAGAECWRLTGEAHYVLDGDVADVLLAAAAAPQGTALFEVDLAGPGVSRAAAVTMDSTRRLAVVRLDGAAGRLIGPAGGSDALGRARDLACIALSGEQVGAAQRALELTVAYTKDRVQFGRPIASFQAVQHRLADLHVMVESSRSLSLAAAAAAAGTPDTAGAPGLGPLAAAAKAHCSEMLLAVTAEMIQLHGAIAITWEHDAHRYFKRAHGAAHLFGDPASHFARVADHLMAIPDGTGKG